MLEPMSITEPDRLRRARWAVAVLFLTNGAIFANAVPRYPDIKADLELSNAAFGSALGAYGAGALLLGLAASAVVARLGSARTAPACVALAATNLVLLALAPSWALLTLAFLLAGSLDSLADVAENVHGLRVERGLGQLILNSLHATWSVGAVLGGGIGSLAAALGVPVTVHFAVVAVVVVAMALVARRHLLPGADGADRPARDPAAAGRRRWARSAAVLVTLGLVASAGQVIEEAGATWSTLYLRDELGAAAGSSGLGFVALQAAQIVGRLVGDPLVTRYGDRMVARAGALLAAAAMSAALLAPSVPAVIAALAVVGLGIGTWIPAGMRTADQLPGLPPGVGITVTGGVVRASLLVAPPVLGLIADATSLRVALVTIPVAALLALVLSPVLAPRHRGG